MEIRTKRLVAAVEEYFTGLRRMRASGGATGERSSYGPLAALLDAVGTTLKPKVFCVGELADQGAGHPDFGLYTARQVQRGRPRAGQAPERGVVEVKSAGDDTGAAAVREQTARYWARYRLVLVTNLREFALIGPGAAGQETALEAFSLAAGEEEFDRRLERPRAFARAVGAGLGEYLRRALAHGAALAEPKDLAWLLASYARDGLARVAAAGDSPALAAVRAALEDALGVRFEGERGARFFRSTLVQTLFYGIFSAWVLWGRARGILPEDRVRLARRRCGICARRCWRALFQQLAQPGRLQPARTWWRCWTGPPRPWPGWTGPPSSPASTTGEAVPYFYEPFLEAFDPELCGKHLGVWYTPARRWCGPWWPSVDNGPCETGPGTSPDGLAAETTWYVLDPCCGTGAYLAEVLRRIAANLTGSKGWGRWQGHG